jgi:hypothetical protein
MRRSIIAIFAIACALPAAASTPAAWAKLDREVKRSCIAASEFRRPRVSDLIIFNDAVGQVALIVSGTYPQPHMKGARGTSLCLYDRQTREAVVEEISGWPALRPGNGPYRD